MNIGKIVLPKKKLNSLNTDFLGTQNRGSHGNLGRFHAYSFVHGGVCQKSKGENHEIKTII